MCRVNLSQNRVFSSLPVCLSVLALILSLHFKVPGQLCELPHPVLEQGGGYE